MYLKIFSFTDDTRRYYHFYDYHGNLVSVRWYAPAGENQIPAGIG
jgi:hypothetical protein